MQVPFRKVTREISYAGYGSANSSILRNDKLFQKDFLSHEQKFEHIVYYASIP